MTTPAAPPPVECKQQFPGLMVHDVLAAVDFYTTKLGFRLAFTWGDPPTMAGVDLGEVGVHLMLGKPEPREGSVYFIVDDADALFEFHRGNGVEIVEPPGRRPWQMRDYRIRDHEGHLLGFGHFVPATEPKLEVERVEVRARLEKRLAALLADLAEHKGMSVGSCLEETLLHSFEPLGEGVASPHTKRTLAHVEELKRKHGIDYDCHASYRFVEKP
jgi:catechol 2,3-dioxygenase-like lactoylglutathione lyase family enzyme